MAVDLALEGLSGLLRALLRGLAWLAVELLFEVLIVGTGRVVLGRVRPGEEPEDGACAVVGLLVWIAAGGLALWLLG